MPYYLFIPNLSLFSVAFRMIHFSCFTNKNYDSFFQLICYIKVIKKQKTTSKGKRNRNGKRLSRGVYLKNVAVSVLWSGFRGRGDEGKGRRCRNPEPDKWVLLLRLWKWILKDEENFEWGRLVKGVFWRKGSPGESVG